MDELKIPASKTSSLKISGASLVEVLMSLALVSIFFVLGSLTWLQLENHQAPHHLFEYRLKARELLEMAELGQTIPEKTDFHGIRLIYSEEDIPGTKGMKWVHLSCITPQGEILFRRSRAMEQP